MFECCVGLINTCKNSVLSGNVIDHNLNLCWFSSAIAAENKEEN